MLGSNPRIDPSVRDKLIKDFGLDQPVFVQYLVWVGRLFRGELGYSYAYSKPVIKMIGIRIPRTIELMILTQVLALFFAIVLGVVSAVKQYSLTDSLAKLTALIGYSAPSFWLGLISIIVFAGTLKWLPSFGVSTARAHFPTILHVWGDHARHLILPVGILSFGWMAYLLRLVRSSMLEVLRSDYILTARAKGLSERLVIYKHALRNALLPVITSESLAIGFIVAGASVIETVFSWPGMGKFMVDIASRRDYPTLMGLSMIITLMVLLSNLIADISYAVVDPRIRYE
jgi:peptide/nickel transport system permease protein